MYMADYSSMKAPELRELLKERGVKINLTRVLKPTLKKMAEEGLMDLPETTQEAKKVHLKLTKDEIESMNRIETIKKIQELRPDITGLTRKSAREATELLKEISTYGNQPLFTGNTGVKQDGKYWIEEAKKLGFKGATLRKKKDELSQIVTAEKKRREEKELEKIELEEEAAEAEEYESAEDGEEKKDLKPSLETFKFLARQEDSQNTDEDLFFHILVVMELFKVVIKRSPYGREFSLERTGKTPIRIDVKVVKKSLQYYLDDMKKIFAKATKEWKIKDGERSKLRNAAEEAMKTDKQIWEGIQNIIVGEGRVGMQMTLERMAGVYYLRYDDDDPPDEDGVYGSGDDFMGTFVGLEEALDDLEDYNDREDEDEDPFVRVPKTPPLDPDRIKPLELEEGQDWKTLTLPNKVKYFLSLVPYEAESMGQIERQSQAKIDRFIERARYDAGLDEEEPSHYFVDWNFYANYENGVNIFDETQWRRADQVPTMNDVKRQDRFFKGVFLDSTEKGASEEGTEYIVNYFGMFAIKEELEKEIQEEIKNPTRFDWRKLSSWVKYKRFNFWRRPIVLEMTKGPMMIVPPYNIYDIRQSTIGVRPIDGDFESDEVSNGEPTDFESIQEQLVESYTKNLPESDDEDYQSAEEEERPIFRRTPFQDLKSLPPKAVGRIMAFSGVPQQEMLPPPVDELEEKMASLSVSSLPPNEQELLPDATPPVEKEEVVEEVVAPPGEYNRFGDLLPAGILPPDEDAQVSPMVSVYGDSDIPRDFVGDWGLDFKGLTTVYPIIDDELPKESGIIWLFAEIVNRENPKETNFIAACEDNKVSGFDVKFEERPDSVYDINTGEIIGTLDREDDKLNFERDNFGGSKEFKEMKVRKITLDGRTYFIDNDNDAIYDGKTFEVVGDFGGGKIKIEKGVADYRTVVPVLPKKAPKKAAEEPAREAPRLKSTKQSSKLNELISKKKKEGTKEKGVFSFLTSRLPEPKKKVTKKKPKIINSSAVLREIAEAEEPRRRPDGTLEGSLG